MNNVILELTVNNHSGVMSHITGLFSRRGFNLEGILCGKVEDGSISRVYLLVKENNTLHQIESQIAKLYDVHKIIVHDCSHEGTFENIDRFFYNTSQC